MEDILKSLVPVWVALPLLLVIFLAKHANDMLSLVRWLTARRKEKLNLIREQLEQADRLSPEMRTHLELTRERVIFEELEGISIDARIARKMIEVSGDQRRLKLPIDLIKSGWRYLVIDASGNLVIIIPRPVWIGTFLLFVLGCILYIPFATMSTRAIWGGLVFTPLFLYITGLGVIVGLLLSPFVKLVIEMRTLAFVLKMMQATSPVVNDTATESEQVIRGELENVGITSSRMSNDSGNTLTKESDTEPAASCIRLPPIVSDNPDSVHPPQ